jgi:glycolate oxidase FAD binding subunit
MSHARANRTILTAPGTIDHHVADLTATIASDVTLGLVGETLGAMGQWLPIDGDEQMSVGQLIERNSTGPLRLGYGAWRDLLLGVQFHNGLSELITAGGRTVKNVAGYDLTKFMVGQRGIFGRLVTVTVRTWRRPAGALLATFAPDAGLVNHLLPTVARPQWAMLTPETLLCGYLGDERTLDYYESALPQWNPRSIERRTLEADIAQRRRMWRQRAFRAAVPPAKLHEFLIAARLNDWVADAAFGVVLGDGDPAAVRAAARAHRGNVTIDDPAGGFDFDDLPDAQRALLERLKRAFDPDGRLEPLPWKRSESDAANA